ncbi:PaaI family thioesterase [Mycolicibacterium sarraceniae]|uniref:PaaI family thioesterase n=1 Tax=Mycolicibacterium sarraceniae TaxID=1534348 RepID=UPI001F3C04B6|nr:PaaI family thioesterase [Mycolicibacterium sarraceniae]
MEGWGKKGAAIMADHLQESAPKHAVEPQDLNAITASMFEGHIGLEFTETKPDRVQARVTMNPVLRQATGVVHGGVYCSIVETVASWGGLLSLDGAGHVVGVNNNTDFLRGVRDDNLLAEGTPVFRGRSQQLWRVVVTTADGRECAVGQVRLHNVYNEDTAPKAQTVAPEPGAMR